MPRYYFDISDGPETGVDDEGLEFPTLQAARNQALATLGEIAREELPDSDHREFGITIRDESGKARLAATLSVQIQQLD